MPSHSVRAPLCFALFLALLLLPCAASAEPFTPYVYRDMLNKQFIDNTSNLVDMHFFLLRTDTVDKDMVDMLPIRYVVSKEIMPMSHAAKGIPLEHALYRLNLIGNSFYSTESEQTYSAYPTSLVLKKNELQDDPEYEVEAYNSSYASDDQKYAPYAEYFVDMALVNRYFKQGEIKSPFFRHQAGGDMPYHLASLAYSNSLRRVKDMSGHESLVARAADTAGSYYEQLRQDIAARAKADGYDAAQFLSSPYELFCTGHAFADVDGDGKLDFMVGLQVNWKNCPYECGSYPSLLILSSRSGPVVIGEFGCTGTYPVGLADINGDKVLDIVTYTRFWEWEEMDVISLAQDQPKLLGYFP